MVFEVLTFDFYLEEKRQLQTPVYMNASTSQWITERIILSPTQYCALLVYFFTTLQQRGSSIEERNS